MCCAYRPKCCTWRCCWGTDGERFADGAWLAQRFQEAGLGFYAVEYPGYGLTMEQGPSEAGIYVAAETALEHLHQKLGVPRERTVLPRPPA
jgi:uncharacterized protein